MVLCVDEKSQTQALERTQPLLPMGLGYVEGVTHDYRRHGTTTLFAALDIASCEVLTQCKRRRRCQEFSQFLNHIDIYVPDDLDVHLIVDNYSTHEHTKVKRWLSQRPRYHVHFTPTYASCLPAAGRAQPVRDLVKYHHSEGHQARLLQVRQRTHRQNTNFHRQLQTDVETFRLDRHRTFHHRKSRTIF